MLESRPAFEPQMCVLIAITRSVAMVVLTVSWRVNMLCLAGALVGVASLILEWGVTTGPFSFADPLIRPSEYGLSPPGNLDFDIWSFMAVFMLGTIVAFFSPMGGGFQAVGIIGFVYLWAPEALYGSTDPEETLYFGFGLYAAIASAIIVLVSLATPIDIGGADRSRFVDKLVTLFISPKGRTSGGPKVTRGTSAQIAFGGALLAMGIAWTSFGLLAVYGLTNYASHHGESVLQGHIVAAAIGIVIALLGARMLRSAAKGILRDGKPLAGSRL